MHGFNYLFFSLFSSLVLCNTMFKTNTFRDDDSISYSDKMSPTEQERKKEFCQIYGKNT